MPKLPVNPSSTSTLSPWQAHKQKWEDCTLCPLCERRQRVVLARGKIPADVLFVGEAPGHSEDVMGQPFAGPAGQLLDSMIERALRGRSVRCCFTNLVGCIPLDETGSKTVEPSEEAIGACRKRLTEIIRIVKPKLLVRVGKLSTKYVNTPYLKEVGVEAVVDVVHPAAILRADISQKGLAIQRVVVTLEESIEEVLAAAEAGRGE